MSEQRSVKPIGEVLRSPRFQKEVSLLLLFFSAVSALFSVFLFAAGTSPETVLPTAIAGFVQAILYAVLAVLIRRGSVKALVITALLFTADTVLTLLGPSWEDARGMLIARGLLIWVIVRYIKRERNLIKMRCHE
jgi:hypothetical protein